MKTFTRVRTDERGFSAVLVVVCLLAIFGAAMLSVDAGQLYTARRNLVTATDASVLSEARAIAGRSTPGPVLGCTGVWSTTLGANANELSDSQCSIVTARTDVATGAYGVVLVQSRKLSRARFSSVLGIGNSRAFSMSAAQWGYVTEPIGLRPIGLCLSDPHVADGLNWAATGVQTHIPNPLTGDYLAPDGSSVSSGGQPAQGSIVHHITFEATCGGPGNFGWVDLDLSPPFPDGDIADWMMNGFYDNHVSLTSPTDCNSDANPNNQPCGGNTGVHSSSNIVDALEYLMDPDADGVKNPVTIAIIIYDTATQSGSNVDYHLVSVAHVRIWGYTLPPSSNTGRTLDLQFVGGTFEGICCDNSVPGAATNRRVRSIRICGVDHDAADPSVAGARCTFI